MIFWLASYPRSGNTFFRICTTRLFGIETPADAPTDVANILEKGVINIGKKRLSVAEMIADQKTFLVKTHKLMEDEFPAIYLVRDGRDSLVSFTHRRLAKDGVTTKDKDWQSKYNHKLKELMTTRTSVFGNWGQNVCHWLNKNSEAMAVVKFEELISHPQASVTKALDKVSYPYRVEGDKVPSFDELHSSYSDSFRRGKIGSYQDEMNHELHELFWSVPENVEAMQRLGYKR